MTPERWREVEAVFQAALEREPGGRAAFILATCAADPALRQEVESLLAAHESGERFLEAPAGQSLTGARAAEPEGEARPAISPDVVEQLGTALAGRYTIQRELGRGGMATVYLAQDLKHSRPVALKVLHPNLAQELGSGRFLREIRTAARLQHPHILPVHDSGEAAGRLWYTMPYVEGESLRDRLEREVQLPVEEALRITREVADALSYAHGQGVIHRDIKPENILLSGGHALLADFGIARALSEAGSERLTATGLIIGTPAYMSPEQASGGRLDGRSDVYSLGCVLFEMLAGEPPYTGPTPQAIIARRFTEPVPSVCAARPGVPAHVEQATASALQKVPADRFATAAEFVEALTQHPQPTRTQATATRHQTVPHRARLAAAAVALLTVIIAGALIVRSAGRAGAGPERRMIAVLPFKNLGPPEDEYFAEGLTEEITSRLANVNDLGIISRTSADQYKGTRKPLRQIGRELGVQYVLEGSVRWERLPGGRSRVRVTPQLIQVSDDSHLWANRYDADLVNIFDVQGNIAEEVTRTLDITLRQAEREALAERPTESVEAYDFYLRGRQAFRRSADNEQNALLAEQMYEKAIELDPQFSLARDRLAQARRYHRSGNVLAVAEFVWWLFLLAVSLITGLSARLRTLAQRIGRRWFFMVILYLIFFGLITEFLTLPLYYYRDFAREHAYGLSNQAFGDWLGDEAKLLLLASTSFAFLFSILYLLLRKSPGRWWLYTGLAAIPITWLLILIQPMWLDPLFSEYRPLPDKSLEMRIQDLASRAGIDQVQVYVKDVDSEKVNIEMSGLGATQRVVIWDTALQKLSPEEMLFVVARLIGYSAMGYMGMGLVCIWIWITLGLYAVHRLGNLLIARFRTRFGFDTLTDVASWPLIPLSLTIVIIVISPPVLAIQRSLNHELDRFALELTRDNRAAVSALLKIQQTNLLVPEHNPLYQLWAGHSPSLKERIHFVSAYRPWE